MKWEQRVLLGLLIFKIWFILAVMLPSAENQYYFTKALQARDFQAMAAHVGMGFRPFILF